MDPRCWRGHLASQSCSLPLDALPLSSSAFELFLSLVMFSIEWSLVFPGRLPDTTKFLFPGRKSNMGSHYFQFICRYCFLWSWSFKKQKELRKEKGKGREKPRSKNKSSKEDGDFMMSSYINVLWNRFKVIPE